MTKIRNAIFACLLASVVLSAQVDPGLANLVMPDVKILSGVRVDSAKASKFGMYVVSQMQSGDPEFQKFIQQTGFDPRRDLWEILAATAGAGDQQTVLVLGKGRFNPAAIVTAAQANGAQVTPHKNGIQLITHLKDNSATGALAFLPDGSTAIMGTLSAVTDAIDRYASAKSTVLPQAVSDQVAALSSKNDAWFLSTVPVSEFFAGKVADPNLGSALSGNLLQAVLQASGGMKFSRTGVQINGQALARSQKDAEALRDVVKFLAGLVQLNKDQDPHAQQIASLLDTMQVTAQDSTMQLSLSIPEAIMEQLFMPAANHHSKTGARKTASVR
jgi:hypothetical protein